MRVFRLTLVLLLLLATPVAAGPFVVRVTVPDEDGEPAPVPGARVAVLRADSVVFAEQVLGRSELVTDSAGLVTLPERPEPGSELLVLAGIALRAIEATRVPPEVRDVTLSLSPEAILTVSVLDAAGRTVPGAEVLVAAEDPMDTGSFLVPGTALFREFTDGTGSCLVFRLSGARRYRLKVSVPGHPPRLARDVPAGGEPVVVRLPAGGVLRGRVISVPGAEPVLKALVRLGGVSAQTDEKGTFVLYGVRPGMHRIEVEAPGLRYLEGASVVVKEGESREGLLIRLQAVGRLRGRVLSSSTLPVVDALVYLRYPADSTTRELLPASRVVEAGRTDEEGRFDLVDLLPGHGVDLIVTHPEHAPAVYLGYPILAGRVLDTLVFLRQGGSISGRVVEGGKRTPVAGARLWLIDSREDPSRFATGEPALPPTSRTAVSSEDGTFALLHVAPGRKTLVVRHEGSLPRTVTGLEVANRDHRTGVEIVLGAGSRLAGRVLDPDGAGVAQARILLAAPLGSPYSAQSDPDGRFLLVGVAPGVYRLRIDAEGYAVHEREGLKLPPEATPDGNEAGPDELEVRLVPAEGVAGRVVLDDTGEAPPEAVVRALARGPPDPLAPERPTYREVGRVRVVAPGGSFLFTTLSPGSYRFEAWTPRGETGYRDGVEVPAAEPEKLEIRLRGGWAINGAVVNGTSGEPVEGAVVSVLGVGEAPENLRAASDELGVFRIDSVPPGHHRLKIEADGFSSRLLESVVVQRAGETRLPDIPLTRGARVRGRISGPDGLPRRGVRIGLRSAALRSERSALSDDWGEFEIENLAEGDWLLVAEERRPNGGTVREERLVHVQEGVELRITLGGGSGASLTGRVTSSAAPVAHARIRALPLAEEPADGRRVVTTTTDEDGRYALAGLPPGDLVLLVYPPDRPTVASRFPVHLPQGPGTVRDLRLPESGIEGRVVDLDRGSPLGGAVLRIGQVSPAGTGSFLERLTRDLGDIRAGEDGRFRIRALPPGQYRIEASLPGYGRTVLETIRVLRGGLTPVEVALAPAGGLAGRVLDPGGRPVSDARVAFFDSKGGNVTPGAWIEVDAEGRFRVDFLRPGRYAVEAQAPGYGRLQRSSVEVPSGRGPDLELLLKPEGRLKINVFGPGGLALEGARVSIRDFWGNEIRFVAARPGLLSPHRDPALTGPDGTLLVPGLTAGVYEVRATLPGYRGEPARVTLLEGESARAAVVLLEE